MRIGVLDRHSDTGECTVDICPLGGFRGAFLFFGLGPQDVGSEYGIDGWRCVHETRISDKKFTKAMGMTVQKGLIS